MISISYGAYSGLAVIRQVGRSDENRKDYSAFVVFLRESSDTRA